MILAVLDTNQLVSMLIRPGGVADQIRRGWQDQRFVLLASPPLLEFRRVLTYPRVRRSIRLTTEEERMLLQLVPEEAEITSGTLEVRVVTVDPADDAVVACAIEGQAGYIVSGDSHLLALREHAGISIVTARTFPRGPQPRVAPPSSHNPAFRRLLFLPSVSPLCSLRSVF